MIISRGMKKTSCVSSSFGPPYPDSPGLLLVASCEERENKEVFFLMALAACFGMFTPLSFSSSPTTTATGNSIPPLFRPAKCVHKADSLPIAENKVKAVLVFEAGSWAAALRLLLDFFFVSAPASLEMVREIKKKVIVFNEEKGRIRKCKQSQDTSQPRLAKITIISVSPPSPN